MDSKPTATISTPKGDLTVVIESDVATSLSGPGAFGLSNAQLEKYSKQAEREARRAADQKE